MALARQINIKNKRASFEYHLLERYVAGIALLGREINHIRAGEVNSNVSFCAYVEDGLYLIDIHIVEYSFVSFYNHEAKRDRKLLLTNKELQKLRTKGEENGFTSIPLRIFI